MKSLTSILRRFLTLTLVIAMVLTMLPITGTVAWAAPKGTVTGLADTTIGLSFSGNAEDAWSASGTQVIGQATADEGTCSTTDYNSTLTIKNNKKYHGNIIF